MDNPNTVCVEERGPQVYVEPITAEKAMADAWERLKQILEADPELMAVFNRMKDK